MVLGFLGDYKRKYTTYFLITRIYFSRFLYSRNLLIVKVYHTFGILKSLPQVYSHIHLHRHRHNFVTAIGKHLAFEKWTLQIAHRIDTSTNQNHTS